MNKIKKYFLFFLLLEMLFSYAPAYAQTTVASTPVYSGVSSQIETYLCSPNNPANGSNPLFNCINNLYKFAIVIASVMGVFFIVIAGYVYMSAEGNNESVEKAKSILTSTITAIVILLAGYVLLKALNPDLVQMQNIQPQSVTLQATTPPATTGGGTGTGATGTGVTGTTGVGTGTTAGIARCVPITDPNNPVSVANLQNSCLSTNATLFSEISDEETGGTSKPSGVDICKDANDNNVMLNGQAVSVSLGLFQINITGAPIGSLNCPSAFSAPYTSTNHICSVTNVALYQQCVAAALNPNQNIQAACAMSQNGANLSPWNGSCFAKWVSN